MGRDDNSQRSRSREETSSRHHRHHHRRRSERDRSASPHRSSRRRERSVDGSNSDSDRERTKRSRSSRQHDRKTVANSTRKRRRSVSSDSSSSSSDDDRHKRHKKSKKSKKSKKKSSSKKKKRSKHSIGHEWGKYGIIHESEYEFEAWLVEVKKLDLMNIGTNKRKELFIDFMDDYNTATMPHEKFYNLSRWEMRQHALRMGEAPPTDDGSINLQRDEEQLRMQHRQAARTAASRQPALQLSREQLEELTKVNRERVQADRLRKMGLTPREGMGVRYEYEPM
ncbi:hypothetical protein BX666DRAFT_2020869 [Dichotomocladium elegans]|nr:hypothetical protein BX666DRAFT_2020869 [Dichotomocladium elegans]